MKTRPVIAVFLTVLLATAGVASALPNPAAGETPTSGVLVDSPAKGPMTPDDRPDEAADGADSHDRPTAPESPNAPAELPTVEPPTVIDGPTLGDLTDAAGDNPAPDTPVTPPADGEQGDEQDDESQDADEDDPTSDTEPPTSVPESVPANPHEAGPSNAPESVPHNAPAAAPSNVPDTVPASTAESVPTSLPNVPPADVPDTHPDMGTLPDHVTLPAAVADAHDDSLPVVSVVPADSPHTEPDAGVANGAPADFPSRGPVHDLPESVPSKVQTIHLTVGQYLDDAVTGKQGHAVSTVASSDAVRPDDAVIRDEVVEDTPTEPVDSDSDSDTDGVDDSTADVRGPATLAERLPDHVKQVHQTVRDFLASLFGGASDE